VQIPIPAPPAPPAPKQAVPGPIPSGPRDK
jgi:hypothetical protein